MQAKNVDWWKATTCRVSRSSASANWCRINRMYHSKQQDIYDESCTTNKACKKTQALIAPKIDTMTWNWPETNRTKRIDTIVGFTHQDSRQSDKRGLGLSLWKTEIWDFTKCNSKPQREGNVCLTGQAKCSSSFFFFGRQKWNENEKCIWYLQSTVFCNSCYQIQLKGKLKNWEITEAYGVHEWEVQRNRVRERRYCYEVDGLCYASFTLRRPYKTWLSLRDHLFSERHRLAGEHLATSPRICIAFFNSWNLIQVSMLLVFILQSEANIWHPLLNRAVSIGTFRSEASTAAISICFPR